MPSYNKVILVEDYQTMSLPDISKKHGISISTVRAALLRLGVTLRTRTAGLRLSSHKIGDALRGKKRPAFSPTHRQRISMARLGSGVGVSFKKNSYVQVTAGQHKHRSVHRIVMEQVIGGPIPPGLVVHHIDENKHNNHPSNLLLMTRSDHARHHLNLRSKKS